MKNYELTLVLPGKATAAKKKAVVERVEKLVKVSDGKVTSSEDWGEKDLAYKIKKHDSGIYLYFDLELSPLAVKNISDKVKLDDDIIRYLLVSSES
jgi:small subunit ribosomal protein S6